MSVLSGMTGFARVSGEADWGSWAWEAKSVNGRGLDVRVNYPQGFDMLDRAGKAKAATLFKRGSLQVSLKIETASGEANLVVNQAALSALVVAYTQAHELKEPPGSDALAALMTVKGVVETGSASARDLAANEAIVSELSAGMEAALEQLKVSRQAEGESLNTIMSRLVSEMETELTSAEEHAKTQPALLKARLEKQLAEIQVGDKVDADRLAAEVALSAAKADVREELDRLAAHLQTARSHLKDGSPIGRKLDFLSQELNREANTLCSKSIHLDLTNIGLAIKGLVDQFKEQAANVE